MSNQELMPCPFCGCAMRIESNRDWHRLVGEHDEKCAFTDRETMMVPALDEQRALVVADWNRRAQPASVAVPEGWMLVERSIWTESQVEAAGKAVSLMMEVPGITPRDLAMVAMDTAQCKAPDVSLSDFIVDAPHPVSGEQSQASRDVLAERERQVTKEGWTPEHDDEHDGGEMSAAAAGYALHAADHLHPQSQGDGGNEVPDSWPWHEAWWKPRTPRRNLVKAAALILAEIERLDRAAHRAQQGGAA